MKRLSAYTTFGIGGEARELVIARSYEALCESAQSKALVLGNGSNVLVADSGYDGTVAINRYASADIGSLAVVGSGLMLPALCKMLCERGKSGMEWAAGIPGTVGGAVRMNAGAFGSCVADRLVYADVVRDGKRMRLYKPELGLSYRHSALGACDIVIKAAFETTTDSPQSIARRMKEFSDRRRLTQPTGRSAGSVFKNPTGMHIAELIEKAGLKGYRVGGAVVSDRHANIIVNTGGATARDVRAVIEKVKQEVSAMFGVMPEEEIVYIGDFD
ncbi:MAG: UDP-N-acetylmuramate dehydrogenase [Clostridiales bacterium]|nr:UDP-N-acetylmuramate dehydrogenase [Clostridiales bacterium]